MHKSYYYASKVLKIERYAILGIFPCEENEYDVFDLKLNDVIKDSVKNFKVDDYPYTQLDDAQFLDLFLGNKDNSKYRNKKIYLYSRVISKEQTNAVINITCLSKAKLWLNNKCLTVHNERHYDPSFCVSAELRKGINDIVLELYINRDWGPLTIELSDPGEADSGKRDIDPIIYIHNTPHYSPELDTFSVMYMTNNINYKKTFRMKILLSGREMKSVRASFNRRIDIDISQLRKQCMDKLSTAHIICHIETLDGKKITLTSPRLILNDFSDEAERVADNLREAARYIGDEVLYHHIIGSIKDQEYEKAGGIMSNYFDRAANNKGLLQQLRDGSLRDDFYLTEISNKVFMYSCLDDSYIKITLRMPVGYNKEKKYPALVSIDLEHGGNFSYTLGTDKLTEPCFLFDVTGRGVTGGSYIGEASILEIVHWLIDHYNIDEHRLYLLGKSSGGFATYSMSQNHPTLPAAIYPLGGYPDLKTLKNISNIPTYQIVSKADFVNRGQVNRVNKTIGKYGNYHQRENHNLYHSDIIEQIDDPEILNAMLGNKKNDFPQRVIYKTYRNRHLRSFWVKLHGISRNCRCANVDASIESDRMIRIRIKGSDGVTITLPPQIERTSFDIIINNQTLHCENYNEDSIVLSRKGGWHISASEPESEKVKGSGLLDVYLNALRVIVPDGASDNVLDSAKAFAQPSSNGFVQYIHVKYPVYKESALPERLTTNLILFDDNRSKSVNAFADHLMIKYDETGFEYKGKRYNSDYVIMQVICNPYCRERSVLVISTNNSRLLNKCFFTRKVIIPFNATGVHPYLNNECLIFTENKYYGIYERGAEIKVIE